VACHHGNPSAFLKEFLTVGWRSIQFDGQRANLKAWTTL
jgi:hypothetical protein